MEKSDGKRPVVMQVAIICCVGKEFVIKSGGELMVNDHVLHQEEIYLNYVTKRARTRIDLFSSMHCINICQHDSSRLLEIHVYWLCCLMLTIKSEIISLWAHCQNSGHEGLYPRARSYFYLRNEGSV